jgi:hypothetical protein
VTFTAIDASRPLPLPFPDASFDAVLSNDAMSSAIGVACCARAAECCSPTRYCYLAERPA